jgi:hypothetical protein
MAMLRAQAQEPQALAWQQRAWKQQHDKLLAVMRADIMQVADQVARKHGCILVAAPVPGATDTTGLVADALRSQWHPGVTP